ncbi:CDP-alcohol phosphatidyltransferase-domain-containing protein [Aspergillus multicolor]|uniref:cardiolipin synthase n=1 Tax=Aspergillus multicolor TaxID=41759 RepID=UPI003CCDEE48
MATSLCPLATRASKLCRLPTSHFMGQSIIKPGWQGLHSSFGQRIHRASIFTLTASTQKRPGFVSTRDSWTWTFKLQQRGSAKKSDTEKPAEPKKSPILSRIPLPSTHENIYTIPNILTFSRLVAAPLVGYFLVHEQHAAALALFAYAGITDLVDGYIARRYNLQTVVGTIIDPMADKLLMTVGVACLAVNGSIPVWLAVIILGRDVGLAMSAIYYRWISLPPPKTMARYWDFSLPSAEVKPTGISKVNTALQLLLVGSAIALPVVPEAFIDAWHLKETMIAFQYLVAATTIWSGLSYVFSKDAVKILSKEEVQKRLARAAGKKNP